MLGIVSRKAGGKYRCKRTHGSIPAVSSGILTLALQRLRICGLQVFATRWLNANSAAYLIVAELVVAISGNWSFAILHGASGGGGHGVVCFRISFKGRRCGEAVCVKRRKETAGK